ncbi:hypothetical protein FHR32_005071 [Streptosporangium album]|uniref:Uncharacterized protein n=1 Tax=Streptosporangium album TaxID=47479 RepID=A0A7W7WBY5_9ACTN|nr:hypothetical protein [Streptosporangium album]MBB4940694.1 hypothetical protein [Streptosporangium album]
MSDYDYGPLQTYEVTWTSGHVERVHCHQVSYSGDSGGLDALGLIGVKTKNERRVHLHGQINGRWLLVLSARETDIAALRLVTVGEEFAGQRFTFEEPGGESR